MPVLLERGLELALGFVPAAEPLERRARSAISGGDARKSFASPRQISSRRESRKSGLASSIRSVSAASASRSGAAKCARPSLSSNAASAGASSRAR